MRILTFPRIDAYEFLRLDKWKFVFVLAFCNIIMSKINLFIYKE